MHILSIKYLEVVKNEIRVGHNYLFYLLLSGLVTINQIKNKNEIDIFLFIQIQVRKFRDQ